MPKDSQKNKPNTLKAILLLFATWGSIIPTYVVFAGLMQRWDDRLGAPISDDGRVIEDKRSYRSLTKGEASYIGKIYKDLPLEDIKIVKHNDWSKSPSFKINKKNDLFGMSGARIHISSVSYCHDFTAPLCGLKPKEVFSDAIDKVYNNLDISDVKKSEASFSYSLNSHLFDYADPGKPIETGLIKLGDNFNRPLTQGEIEWLKKTYKDYLSYDDMRIVYRGEKGFTSMVYGKDGFFNLYGDNIHMGDEYYCEDFSSSKCSDTARKILRDEALHIYKQQNTNADLSFEGPAGPVLIEQTLQADDLGVPIDKATRTSERFYRTLTSGEVDMLKKMFNNSVNYKDVKIVYHREWPAANVEGYVIRQNSYGIDGLNIHFEAGSICSDFSKSSCYWPLRYIFIHEFTHVYQNTNPISVRNEEKGDYDYEDRLSLKVAYEDFGLDEQAELVSSYYMNCIEMKGAKPDTSLLKNPKVGQIIQSSLNKKCDLNPATGNSVAKIIHRHFNLTALPTPKKYIITDIGQDNKISFIEWHKNSAKKPAV